MAKNKTTETEGSVSDFINNIENENKRSDSFRMAEILAGVTGYTAKMWGPAIIGFGARHYKYESGREGDIMLVGFSPRKAPSHFILLISRAGKHYCNNSESILPPRAAFILKG